MPIGPGTIAGHVADKGRTVLIDDVYDIPKRSPYKFDPKFEVRNYQTHSMFCFSLKNLQDEVIGVVQLINCRPRKKAKPVPFAPDVETLVAPIARVVGHSIERAEMLDQIRDKNKTLRVAHERWDGTGYPNGVKGNAIPLSARIVQIADIYDALRAERPYKPAFSHEKSVDIITKGDDRIDPLAHFDAKLVQLFQDNHQAFDKIWISLKD